MAELFLAQDTKTNRLTVLKRILPYLAQEQEFVQMFLDEARIAGQLNHPNVVEVYELGHLEGSIFIAMEFVEGVDLRKIVQQEGKRQGLVPPGIAAWLVARLCEGLHYAHHVKGADGKPMGIIHRDISPQNVMVGYDGAVKLVDFGIAKANAYVERSKPGVIKGKFLYLSPEQLSQERIDHRADLFAVGTMLYEVTTGRSPFHKPSTEAVIYAIRAEDPPPPHLLSRAYPTELSRIIMRCLAKDRAKRYQTAGEIHADLEAWLRKEPKTSKADVIEYVGHLFGNEDERTSIFIPPNAIAPAGREVGGSEVVPSAMSAIGAVVGDKPETTPNPTISRSEPTPMTSNGPTRVDSPQAHKKNVSEDFTMPLPRQGGAAAVPAPSAPTTPSSTGNLDDGENEGTKPIGVAQEMTPPMPTNTAPVGSPAPVGRRPTPAPAPAVAPRDDLMTQTMSPGEQLRSLAIEALSNPRVPVTAPPADPEPTARISKPNLPRPPEPTATDGAALPLPAVASAPAVSPRRPTAAEKPRFGLSRGAPATAERLSTPPERPVPERARPTGLRGVLAEPKADKPEPATKRLDTGDSLSALTPSIDAMRPGETHTDSGERGEPLPPEPRTDQASAFRGPAPWLAELPQARASKVQSERPRPSLVQPEPTRGVLDEVPEPDPSAPKPSRPAPSSSDEREPPSLDDLDDAVPTGDWRAQSNPSISVSLPRPMGPSASAVEWLMERPWAIVVASVLAAGLIIVIASLIFMWSQPKAKGPAVVELKPPGTGQAAVPVPGKKATTPPAEPPRFNDSTPVAVLFTAAEGTRLVLPNGQVVGPGVHELRPGPAVVQYKCPPVWKKRRKIESQIRNQEVRVEPRDPKLPPLQVRLPCR